MLSLVLASVFLAFVLVTDLCATEVEIGSRVVRVDGGRCVRDDGEWVLEVGEVAIVTTIDKGGDFKLTNPGGVVTRKCQVRQFWGQAMQHSQSPASATRNRTVLVLVLVSALVVALVPALVLVLVPAFVLVKCWY